jgi:hypothetical protein
VWGTSPTNVWASGTNGTLLHFNGTTWGHVTSGVADNLHGVWGRSRSEVYVVGDNGTILQYAPPTIAAVSPAVGSIDGGTVVSITGTGFQDGGVTSVLFGASLAAAVSVTGPGTLTATTPAHPQGAVPITLLNAAGLVAREDAFEFQLPPRVLTVQSQHPSSGVAVTVTPGDNASQGNGSTSFTRTYQQGSSVTLTAPASVGINPFERWLKDGAEAGTGTSLTVTMDTDHAVTAVYTLTNPSPVLSSLSPASVTAGASGFTVAVTGTGFVSGAAVRWNGSPRTTTFVSATVVNAAISAGDVATAGTATVTVVNPAPTVGASNALTFTVNPPAPVISTIAPAQVVAGSGATTLTVNGTGFRAGAVVQWNGTPRTTTFISATQLTAAVLAGDVAAVGTATVTVLNPSPVPGPSNGVTFTVTEVPTGFESDVAPRGAPNGSVSTTDWVQIGRFVAGLDVVSTDGGEFQRADAAPRSTFGDGRITASDWVQAGRYAASLDPATTAAGPAVPVTALRTSALAADVEHPRRVALVGSTIELGTTGTVALRLTADGSEQALGMGVRFDPSVLRFAGATAAPSDGDVHVIVNDTEAAQGRIGILAGRTAGTTWTPGDTDVVYLTFHALVGGRQRSAHIGFDDAPVIREVADADGHALPTSFVDGSVTVAPNGRPVSVAPIGHVDLPSAVSGPVRGTVAISGWALDDREVTDVTVYRACLPMDLPASCQRVEGHQVVYLGNATFVRGARPDVADAYPAYTKRDRAGWGFALLTAMLPDVTRHQLYGGDGALTLFVVARDADGHQTVLRRTGDSESETGSLVLQLDNTSLAAPFGVIDTPGPGDTVRGVVPVLGWALTPDRNRSSGDADIIIPTDGTTVTVFVDGITVGMASYNQCRGTGGAWLRPGAFCDDDVANVFGAVVPDARVAPRSSNPTVFRNLDAGRGAIGSFLLDTTTLTDGLHSLAWSVRDSDGRTASIGSRLIQVANDPPSDVMSAAPVFARFGAADASRAGNAPTIGADVWMRHGFDDLVPWTELPASYGARVVRVDVLDRLELWFGQPVEAWWEHDGERRPLPVGASVRGARFTWAPPPGYSGLHTLVFQRGAERVVVTIEVR